MLRGQFAFADYLRENRHRLLHDPVPSGWNLLHVLWWFSEDCDEPVAAELYLILGVGGERYYFIFVYYL